MRSAAPAVGLPTHSPSGSYRQEFKGPLPYASSAGTTIASRRTRWSEGDGDRRPIRKKDSSVSFPQFLERLVSIVEEVLKRDVK